MNPAQQDIRSLKGIGPARAAAFAELGIHTLADLISYRPRAYEDRSTVLPIRCLQPGKPACFRACVVSQPKTARVRKGLLLTRLRVADETGTLSLTFFNQSYTVGVMQPGQSYVFWGTAADDGSRSMTNPVFEPAQAEPCLTRRILPVYSATAALSSAQIARAVQQALDCSEISEILPAGVLQGCRLLGAAEAAEGLHRPRSMQELQQARRRIVFEEFFVLCAGLLRARARRQAQGAAILSDTDLAAFLEALPFVPTQAQQAAMADTSSDLRRGHPMARLIQGDVGSGKTAVAAAAVYLVCKNGLQAAMMVPTEILARQQFRTLSALLAPLGLRCALFTGSVRSSERQRLLQDLAQGRVDFVCGTHALIGQNVQFASLGLVVVDEQHRFGTAQRGLLAAKGLCPHMLVMSATPIPRTLALLVYGELDISVLAQKPPGRVETQTFLVGEALRPRVNAFIRKQVCQGHQVFIVCPCVEEQQPDLKSARAWAQALQAQVFPDLRVALLHGKLGASEKERVMTDFVQGRADILVATTVIEVGIDVPNATVMVIENAEQFGLSQLHQLRGRIGRGSDASYCILFAQTGSEQTLSRLRAFASTSDGFVIAQQDLQLRGPGDVFGTRQHGLPALRIADLVTDVQLLVQARQAAQDFLRQPDAESDPAYPLLDRRINGLFSQPDTALN